MRWMKRSGRPCSRAERGSKAKDPLPALLAHNSAFFTSRTYLAMIELALAGRESQPLLRIHRNAFVRFRKQHDRVWIDALVAAGYERASAREFVELTVYLLRGNFIDDAHSAATGADQKSAGALAEDGGGAAVAADMTRRSLRHCDSQATRVTALTQFR